MKSCKLLLTLFVFLIIVTTAVPNLAYAATTRMYVDPKYTGIDAEGKPLKPGATFKIDVKIADAYDVVSWSFMLFYDKALLNVTKVEEGPFLKSRLPDTRLIKKINETAGWVDVACISLGFEYGADGSGTLASITFLVEGTGETTLDLRGSLLMDHFVVAIDHEEIDGGFSNSEMHDIAVTAVTAYPTIIEPGHVVHINVTVENQGDATETFNVTVYYDKIVIDTMLDITLDAKGSKVLEFVWNTPSDLAGGDYTIKAVASFVPKEADTADNTFIDGVVSTPEHDIMVLNVTATPKQVSPGQTVSIGVTVKNKGDFVETFDVAVYYDSTFLDTESVSGLEPNETQVLSFVWDTSGVSEGGYRVKAVVGPISGEVKTADNTLQVYWYDAIEVITIKQSFSIGTIGAAIAVVVVVAAAVVVFVFRHKF